MQKFLIEARRGPETPWAGVQTVGEDLLDFANAQVMALVEDGDPTEWRVRPEESDVRHPEPPAAPSLPKVTRWARLRVWFLMRFTRSARR